MAGERIRPGDDVLARDFYDQWLPAVAASEVQGTHDGRRKVHNFPGVYLRFGNREPVFWPATDVRLAASSGGDAA